MARWLSIAVVLFFSPLAARHSPLARAEELLHSLTHIGQIYDPGVMPPNRFIFSYAMQPCCDIRSVIFSDELTPADEGRVFEAGPAELATLNAALASGGVRWLSVATLFDHRDYWVPEAFDGQRLTRITQTIDQLDWVNTPHLIANGQQTLRFYGVPVPEPSAWILVVIVLGHFAATRRSKLRR